MQYYNAEHMSTQAKLKREFINKIIKNVPFTGWTAESLQDASIQLGYDKSYAEFLFSEGIPQIIDMMLVDLDKKMLSTYFERVQDDWGITRKVEEALKIRFELMASKKELYKKTALYLSLPWNLLKASSFSWRVADVIWHDIIQDKSLDYNYYSKRSLLAGIYASSILIFLSDDSQDHEDTFDFISRRVKDVVKLGKNISKLKKKYA